MDAKDILALVRAGYTKEEISAMGTTTSPVEETSPVPVLKVPESAPVPAPVPDGNTDPYPVAEPVPVPAPAPVPTPAPTPVPTPVPEQAQPTASDIMREIARLTSAVQANAISNSSIPMGTGVNVEDVMASIIKPTRGARQNG